MCVFKISDVQNIFYVRFGVAEDINTFKMLSI